MRELNLIVPCEILGGTGKGRHHDDDEQQHRSYEVTTAISTVSALRSSSVALLAADRLADSEAVPLEDPPIHAGGMVGGLTCMGHPDVQAAAAAVNAGCGTVTNMKGIGTQA